MIFKRIFLIVLDSFGIGAEPDAGEFGDAETVNTLKSVLTSDKLNIPNLKKLGLFNIEGVESADKEAEPGASFARLQEASKGKDTTIGHWEIAGLVSDTPLPTYPDGFPPEIIKQLEDAFGRKVICNKPYSGTQVIHDYGQEHMDTGALIVYTSADSVLQIAAHEDVVPVDQLYEYCRQARKIMTGEHSVGRIIARPFIGEFPNFERTPRRHDYSMEPPGDTILDLMKVAGNSVVSIGKINDIFAGRGISRHTAITSNEDGMEKAIAELGKDYYGLCFVNLVDFDMKYGHRRDVDGYAAALTRFDEQLGEFLPKMKRGDVLIITADHGCDPLAAGTDHTREYVPMLVCGEGVKKGIDLGTRHSFADIAATISKIMRIPYATKGKSFWEEVKE
ncbi:Phosphopentomutase [Anaerovibrio sp. JC8]|uniref:phosphopentomutase n=1 Tax=Anaerovibrio sp. JC8 TaxID=1240085 RepID=UPI000A0E35D4|nr:phosphopentomutase [Anaerovibrio sp. JC8]ORU01054.1 Phosphopentomutase [Anaerovibrio sp. JC8]